MKFQAFYMNSGEKLKKKDVNNDLSNFMTVFPNSHSEIRPGQESFWPAMMMMRPHSSSAPVFTSRSPVGLLLHHVVMVEDEEAS